MADNPTACGDYFDDCSKTEITWSMFWKKLIGKSGDCPAIRVTGDLSASINYPEGNLLTSVKAVGTDGDTLNADVIAKLAALGSKKVFSVGSPAVDQTDITKSFVLITYFI